MTNRLGALGMQFTAADERAGAINAERDLDGAVRDLADYMLFVEAAPLSSRSGVSTATKTFAAGGPRDPEGRSLREFDLRTRLFRYPVSYMIYSELFDALPRAMRERVYQRLHDVLTGKDASARTSGSPPRIGKPLSRSSPPRNRRSPTTGRRRTDTRRIVRRARTRRGPRRPAESGSCGATRAARLQPARREPGPQASRRTAPEQLLDHERPPAAEWWQHLCRRTEVRAVPEVRGLERSESVRSERSGGELFVRAANYSPPPRSPSRSWPALGPRPLPSALCP